MADENEEPQTTAQEEPERWTRERLEAAIAEHGGPEGLDLAGADMSKLDLSEMDLHGIILHRWDREGGTHIAANLQGASLWDANLQGANLRGVNLQKASLGRANLQRAELYDANLQGAYLWGANLQEAKLEHANLQEAKLEHANLQEAKLDNANLQEADLWDTLLKGAKLVYANLQEAKLDHANLQEAYLGRANLQGANLQGTKLQGAILWFANLQGADLRGTFLQEADLEGANLQEANLRFADLREVDLLDVISLQGAHLYRAKLGHTALKREPLGPAIGEELAGEYREARDVYLALKQNFEDLGDYEGVGWAYRKERRMEKLWARQKAREARSERNWREAMANYAKYASDQLVEWICDYGEGIWRVVGALAAVWIIFAVAYGLIAGVWGPWQETATSQMREVTRNLIHLLAFSLGAMTTLEPAGLEARSMLAMNVLMPLEALLGIFFAGLLGFVAGNRIRRS